MNSNVITCLPWKSASLTVAAVLSAIVFNSCNSLNGAQPAKEDNLVPAHLEQFASIKVETQLVEEKTFEYSITTNGKVRSAKEELFTAPQEVTLTVNNAAEGKGFRSGEVIAKLNTAMLQYDLERLKLNYFNAEKEYQSQLLGYENLLKGKTKEEQEVIKQKLRISSGLATTEQDIKQTEYKLSQSVIRAPFNGVLADVEIKSRQQVTPGTVLFRIYDPDNLLVELKVLEADVHLLKRGAKAEISPLSMPEKKYAAQLDVINPYVDENGQVTVRYSIQTRDKELILFPGMNCYAFIKIPFEKAIVVPRDALVMRGGKPVVFTLESGKAKWNYVTVGRENGKEVEILSGLNAGQKVITTNNLQLSNDAYVEESFKGTASK